MVVVCVPRWSVQVTETRSPDLCDRIAVPSEALVVIVVPPTLLMTAPTVIPADSAGEPG
jgi:hypothetical protein